MFSIVLENNYIVAFLDGLIDLFTGLFTNINSFIL